MANAALQRGIDAYTKKDYDERGQGVQALGRHRARLVVCRRRGAVPRHVLHPARGHRKRHQGLQVGLHDRPLPGRHPRQSWAISIFHRENTRRRARSTPRRCG
ncbi:MAG: hypothetical protein MZV70_35325 [Desulfobacterales bacterium]|nr:hypothetical protein [Desulfobacterales bacterium]